MNLLERNARIWLPPRKRPYPYGTKRKHLIGGIVCLAIWPGIGVLELLLGIMDSSETWFLVVSPWIVVTVVGISLLMTAATITETSERQKTRSKDKEE